MPQSKQHRTSSVKTKKAKQKTRRAEPKPPSDDCGALIETLKVRLTATEKMYITKSAEHHRINISQWVRTKLFNDHQNKDLLAMYHEIERNLELSKIYQTNKRASYFMYFDKNAMRRIFDSATYNRFNNGKINMDEIQFIIDQTLTLYEKLPKNIQRIKRESMKELLNLKNKEYLHTKMGAHWKRIEQESQRHITRIGTATRRITIQHQEQQKKNKMKEAAKQ